ncbi:TRAP transporter substrate-binding protein [Bacillus sp. FJAT-45350]|uniref:TRAP transporter substrate-binding protein n=1 Tax=Bacillus sp. FJAT-45350 TaxID=2011014 RepID=UPI000BB75D02|nr:TRAP transporter substrate-binding protein [Bacillus sp. FJAT-45350]
MKLKKSFSLGIFITFITLALAACGGEQSTSSGGDSQSDTNNSGENSVTLTLAATNDDAGIDKAIREYFTEQISELSDGSIEMQFFMGGQLGGGRETLEQLKVGELDMSIEVLHAELYYPKYNAANIPFLFEDFESVQRYKDDVRDEIDQLNRDVGGVIELGDHNIGTRYVTSNKPFTSADDIKGLRIRMPEMAAWINSFQAIGASPTPIAASEIVTALQTGTVDAQENTLTNIFGRQMWEYQDYLIDTGHSHAIFSWLVSVDAWEHKLSENQQEALQQAVQNTVAYVAEIVDEENERFIQLLQEEGMEFIEADKESFRKNAVPAVESFIEDNLAPGILDEIKKAMN